MNYCNCPNCRTDNCPNNGSDAGQVAAVISSDLIAARKCLRDCEKALDSLPSDALGQHSEIGHYFRDELLANVRHVLKHTADSAANGRAEMPRPSGGQ
jgi:hypothetical protein